MTTLYDAMTALVDREGGFVDHPADRGGPTCWGVTEAVARAFGYTGRMQDLSRNMAMQIFRERYWTQPKFDQVATRFQALADELLDTGVNMGTAVAGRFLQRALNVLNREAKDFPDVTADGAIGKMTLYALDRYLATRGAEGRTVLLAMVNAQQSVRYIEIAEGSASQEAFEFGWQRTRASSTVTPERPLCSTSSTPLRSVATSPSRRSSPWSSACSPAAPPSRGASTPTPSTSSPRLTKW